MAAILKKIAATILQMAIKLYINSVLSPYNHFKLSFKHLLLGDSFYYSGVKSIRLSFIYSDLAAI